MKPEFLIVCILFPIFAAVLMPMFGIRRRTDTRIYVGTVTLLTSLLAWTLILKCGEDALTLVRFTDRLAFTLKFDKAGRFFAGIIATLWPLTVLYGFEYLSEDECQHRFFIFFTMAYGVTLGVAMAGNIFTLYCFYELLTLSTAPLVMHTKTKDAIRAVRLYFTFSLGGAAFAFVSMIYLVASGGNVAPGNITSLFYLMGFFGFGVKAAVFPLHIWLPRASVAPTPVTALLHAVAVVKSGVFAIIRLTYFGYGTEVVSGTWAQYAALFLAIFTILYGSVNAVRERHWKRRLAYSTVSNLSYILFGVLLMTSEGLTGGLLHMAFHAEIKILAFFAAGAVLHVTEREYIAEMDGLGKKMPVTFTCFLVAALGLTGIPPFAGFVSKWHLLSAAAAYGKAGHPGTALAYIGAAVILISALLTAIYCFSVIRRAFFPDKDADPASLEGIHDADWKMLVPMSIIAVGIVLTGLFGGQILNAVQDITSNISLWM